MIRAVLALLLAVSPGLRAAGTVKPADRPNVIILLADDMGYGDLRCFNPQSKIGTPHIDRLAREGMRFTDAHAAGSICVPSRYGLLSGRLPFRTWSAKDAQPRSRNGRDILHFPPPMIQHEPDRLNLATMLRRQGYATACVGKWHQGMSRDAQSDGTLKTTPVDAGFDYYFGFDAPEQAPYAFIENKRFTVAPTASMDDHPGTDVTNPETQGAHWRKGPAAPGWRFEDVLPTLADKADAWLAKQAAVGGAKPFFLYYAFPAPHAPWTAADEFKGRSGAGLYGDYVMTVDAMVGRVLATLEKAGLKDNTLILFSSDNGPVWYPEDVARFGHRAAGPWNGMKGALTEAGHRVPFIVRWPGRIDPGATCGALVCFTDLMATLAAVTGAELPAGAGEDSFDISPLLRGQKPARPVRERLVHVNYGSYTLAIREGDWKLILPEWVYTAKDGAIAPDRVVEAPGRGPRVGFQLFNLAADPGEVSNLADKEPKRVAALFESLRDILREGVQR